MNFLKKILDKFKPEEPILPLSPEVPNPNPGSVSSNTITNQQLLDQLVSHFSEALLNESVGNRMLYPMSYNVIMHNEDYNARIQALPFVLPEIVAAFYRKISEMSNRFPNYNPPAKYWFFQFSGCNVESIPQGGNVLNIQKGRLTTIAQLLTSDASEPSGTSIETNVNVSIKIEGSDVMAGTNIDPNALKNLDMVSENIFKFKFDPTLNGDTKKIQAYSNMELAELSYTDGAYNYKFSMQDNLIHVSGNGDIRKGREFFKVKNDNIQNSHVQIKHDQVEQKFYIATFGNTRVNGKAVQMSEGGNVIWHPLANNSTIFFPEAMMSLKFKIKE